MHSNAKLADNVKVVRPATLNRRYPGAAGSADVQQRQPLFHAKRRRVGAGAYDMLTLSIGAVMCGLP